MSCITVNSFNLLTVLFTVINRFTAVFSSLIVSLLLNGFRLIYIFRRAVFLMCFLLISFIASFLSALLFRRLASGCALTVSNSAIRSINGWPHSSAMSAGTRTTICARLSICHAPECPILSRSEEPPLRPGKSHSQAHNFSEKTLK